MAVQARAVKARGEGRAHGCDRPVLLRTRGSSEIRARGDTEGEMAKSELTRREILGMLGLAGVSVALSSCGLDQDPEGAATPGAVAPVTTASVPSAPAMPDSSTAERILGTMTLEQKVAQLFFVTPEQLTGADCVTEAGEAMEAALATLPVGGVICFSQNIETPGQLREMLANVRRFSTEVAAGIPVFLGVDEEGGPLVSRVANSPAFDVATFPHMAAIGGAGDVTQAERVGTAIGSYLHEIGFNVDFAPVADVLTNPENTVIGPRSFGTDSQLVADMVVAEATAMLATGVLPCVKHFPGHGDTNADSHTGEAVSTRTREDLDSCEFEPFRCAIAARVPLVMVGHIKTPNAAADDLPASLSRVMIEETLRRELGFGGIIISDSFQMGAVTERFSPAEAAVKFLEAGGDMILMPEDLDAAYQGVLDAVASGILSRERIDESCLRVMGTKSAL